MAQRHNKLKKWKYERTCSQIPFCQRFCVKMIINELSHKIGQVFKAMIN